METRVSAPFQFNQKDGNLTESTAYSAEETISITSALNNVSITSPYTVTGAIGTNTAPWMTSTLSQMSAPKIKLDGEGADIEVNGWSLVDAVKRIEERLGLYQPNPELEREWEDLHELAEQYRRLEQHIRDKQATFDRLKAMPAPDND